MPRRKNGSLGTTGAKGYVFPERQSCWKGVMASGETFMGSEEKTMRLLQKDDDKSLMSHTR